MHSTNVTDGEPHQEIWCLVPVARTQICIFLFLRYIEVLPLRWMITAANSSVRAHVIKRCAQTEYHAMYYNKLNAFIFPQGTSLQNAIDLWLFVRCSDRMNLFTRLPDLWARHSLKQTCLMPAKQNPMKYEERESHNCAFRKKKKSPYRKDIILASNWRSIEF